MALLIDSPASQSDGENGDAQAEKIEPRRYPQEFPALLPDRPRTPRGERQDIQPFDERRQTAIRWMRIPVCRSLGQQQFGPPASRFLLLPSQPIAKCRHQIV